MSAVDEARALLARHDTRLAAAEEKFVRDEPTGWPLLVVEPRLLAALCDEVERLRALVREARDACHTGTAKAGARGRLTGGR